MIRAALFAALVLGPLPVPLAGQGRETRHVLIITGVSGEPQYAARFTEAAGGLVEAFRGPLRLPADRLTWLSENPGATSGRSTKRSARAEVEAAFLAIANRVQDGDLVVVLLIGHGSSAGEPRFNLPGPDLTAADYAALLAPLTNQTVVFINAASASGDFVGPLSGPNRIVMTATKTGLERNETQFADMFVKALAGDGGDGADTDKDGAVSVLEAFQYTTREVARLYETTNRLQTEHALLDDDGDGKGATAPTGNAGDGLLARRITFAPSAVTLAGADTALRRLLTERDSLQNALDALRRQKDALPAADYEKRLEDLLVRIAEVSAAVRAREAKP